MIQDLHPTRYAREELELLQQRALRSWLDSTWLAEKRPRSYQAVEDFPEDQVWLDLGGGLGEADQYPGAIVLGTAMQAPEDMLARGQRRPCDLWWLGPEVPAATSSVDKVILASGSLRRFSPGEAELLLKEIKRALLIGGLLVVDEDAGKPLLMATELGELGFQVEGEADGPTTKWRALSKVEKWGDEGKPILREKVLGELRPQGVRRLG